MYFPYFLTYMGVGITVAVVVFIWAIKSGQFTDQQRARFLPLDELDEADAGLTVGRARVGRLETYILAFLACAGLAASGAVLMFALFFS